MTSKEFYLNLDLKYCYLLAEYEKELASNLDNDSKLTFNKNWILKNKYNYKKIINKPVGLPAILLSSANEYLYIVQFFKLFKSLNVGILSDEDLDEIPNLY